MSQNDFIPSPQQALAHPVKTVSTALLTLLIFLPSTYAEQRK